MGLCFVGSKVCASAVSANIPHIQSDIPRYCCDDDKYILYVRSGPIYQWIPFILASAFLILDHYHCCIVTVTIIVVPLSSSSQSYSIFLGQCMKPSCIGFCFILLVRFSFLHSLFFTRQNLKKFKFKKRKEKKIVFYTINLDFYTF